MSDIARDKVFYELADAHLRAANEHMARVKPVQASAALLFAASRFNAFVIQAASANKGEMLAQKEAAIAYFLNEYETYLRENIDEHLKRYED
ncbi:MAG: DUF3144 domain-containing protein [Thiobacillus sp.]|nr:DUF3144 domain-containing protein [Thiobacillus sp.]